MWVCTYGEFKWFYVCVKAHLREASNERDKQFERISGTQCLHTEAVC